MMRKLLPLVCIFLLSACVAPAGTPSPQATMQVPHDQRWGIYRLDLSTQAVELIHSSPFAYSCLRLNPAGDRFVFSQTVGSDADESEEIFTLSVDGNDLQQLTDNNIWDLCPTWSPDGSQIAFLSWHGDDLDLYRIDADGSNYQLLYDSGFHDSDIHWDASWIVFTSQSRIWAMHPDGSDLRQLTDPPRAGEWGNANLPFGDYDPRISPDGTRVVFERLVDDSSPHGNYNFYLVDIDGSNLTALTDTGYAQGMASWSHAGDRLVYPVGAINDVGQYRLYMVNADGSQNRDITPDYFPPGFLCQWAIFSPDDTTLYFVGEWWSQE